MSCQSHAWLAFQKFNDMFTTFWMFQKAPILSEFPFSQNGHVSGAKTVGH